MLDDCGMTERGDRPLIRFGTAGCSIVKARTLSS